MKPLKLHINKKVMNVEFDNVKVFFLVDYLCKAAEVVTAKTTD